MSESAKSLGTLLREDNDPADSPKGRRAGKDAVLTFFKSVATKNRAAFTANLTDDVIHEIPFSESGSTEPGQYRHFEGKQAVVDFWMSVADGNLEVGRTEDVDLSVNADGSRIFIEQRGNITMPSGKIYRNRYVFRFDIRDGKVCHSKEYFNPVTAAYAFDRPIAGRLIVKELP